MRTVAAVPALGLLVGAWCGLLLPARPYVAAYVALSTTAAVAIWAWGAHRPDVVTAAAASAFSVGGALLSNDAWQRAWHPPLRTAFEAAAHAQRARAVAAGRIVPEDEEAAMTVAGILRADAAPGRAGISLSVDVDDPGEGGIVLAVVGELAATRMGDWRAGRRVRVPATLRRPSRYLDPGVPDFERALARRGTTLVGTVKSGALVVVEARGDWFAERLGDVRAFSRRAIDRAVGRWSPRSAAIVNAIVIGDRTGLDEDVERRLQEAGTYHVIAISGGNIAILAALMLGAYRVAGVLGPTAMLSSIALLIAYAALVGGGASVDRATLMAVIVLAGRAFDQRGPPLNTLAVAAAALVAAEPLSILDPSFILTFGATLAILVAAPVAAAAVTTATVRGRLVVALAAMFAASLASEAMLFPIAAVVFSRVTFAGLALNFLAIPLMGVAQVAGMAVVPLALMSDRAATAAGWAAHVGAAGLVRSSDLLQLASRLSYRVARPNAAIVVVYYVAGCGSWILWRRRVTVSGSQEARSTRCCRWFGSVAAVLAACWILAEPWALAAAGGDGRLHVTFVDVGQGDSAFVRFPHGSSMLVDAGGLGLSSTFDIGDRVVAPVLRDAGVRRLDIVALSHGDPDHIGGAASIVREFRPRQVWEGIPVPRFEPLTKLRLAVQGAAAWANVYAGDRLVLEGVEIVALHPEIPDWERQKVRNDDSMVLDLRWRDVSILLTGDIGRPVERELAARVSPARLRVVKVPHHGSLTSSTPEFVRAIHAAIAVASAGRGNHFGHPVPEVLQRYRDAGAEVFRTDQDGAVTVDTDGRSIDVRTYTGRTYRATMH